MANHIRQINGAVTLPKHEYLRLKEEAQAYRAMAAKVFELPLRDPVNEVVADFRAAGLYSDEFLADLEDGLQKSSYADQTTARRS